MNLVRRLLRAFLMQPPRRVVVRRETTAREPRGAPHQPRTTRHVAEIEIVDVFEIQGRAWVIDGDTIDIGGTRIRLADIDAPELDHPYGQNAKRALIRLCQGNEVRAVFAGDLSHHRKVATCYLPDGRDLSAEMVKSGHAIDWPKFSNGRYGNLEPDGIRKRLWRCDARQKGRMPPTIPD